MSQSSFYNSPTLCYNYRSSFLDPCAGDSITEEIARRIREQQNYITWTYSYPNAVAKLNNEKETKKMEAKKCDRCGKLYEKDYSCDDVSMKVRFKHMFVACKEDLSEQRIIDKQTEKVAIRYDGYGNNGNDRIDLCPDCCESFKRWFENG